MIKNRKIRAKGFALAEKKQPSMKHYVLYLFLVVCVGCSSVNEMRYKKAYETISKDFMSRENAIQMFGKDISGILIYDSIYPNPMQNDEIHIDIISDKENERTNALRKDKTLTKLSRENLNPNWELDALFNTIWGGIVQYQQSNLNGPLKVALFSEIEHHRLRVDVVPFFMGRPKYCGDIYKYYFVYDKKEIITYKKWTDHYECW